MFVEIRDSLDQERRDRTLAESHLLEAEKRNNELSVDISQLQQLFYTLENEKATEVKKVR